MDNAQEAAEEPEDVPYAKEDLDAELGLIGRVQDDEEIRNFLAEYGDVYVDDRLIQPEKRS